MLLQVSRLLIQETKKSLHFCFLTQAPTPLHSMGTSSQVKIELADSLSYSEGCYGSLPTLHETKNLWRLPGHLTVVQLLCFLLWTWHYLSPLVSELQRNRVISQDTICCEKKTTLLLIWSDRTWRPPADSLYSVNNVVQYWFLNLEVNGCHKLLSAGADGVVQVR